MKAIANMKETIANYKAMDSKDKTNFWKETLLNNAPQGDRPLNNP